MTNTTTLQVGLSTPRDLGDLAPLEQQARLAAMADAGIDFVFTADHVSFHGGAGMDGLLTVGVMGGLEPKLDMYVGVMLLALRHPMVAARQIATLANLAPGRLTVGVGVGGEDRHEFEVCGVDPRTRGRRTDVAMAMVRSLLDGEVVDGDGEFFDFADGRILPAPNPRVPFTVGGRSNAALERAGRLGDGWIASWCSPRRFAEGIEIAAAAADEAGRSPEWKHGLQTWVGVGADAADARTHVAKAMSDFYKLDFEMFERYTPVGNPHQIAEFLHPFVEAGATTLNLTPVGADRAVEVETIAEVKRLLLNS